MTSLIIALKRLLTEFAKTWAERDALLRVVRTIGQQSGGTATWERVFETSQQRAQELFQPALLGIDSRVPLDVVLEKLLIGLAESK